MVKDGEVAEAIGNLRVTPKMFEDDPPLAKAIADFVNDGGGLVFMPAQSWTDDHPLAALLPVTIGKPDELEAGDAPPLTRPRITGAGLRGSVLRLVDDPMRNQQLWREELAPTFGPPLPVKPRHDATVLAVDPQRRLDGQPVPLVAVGSFGKGRVVFLNNSQTWRWRTQPIGNHHGRFWKQVTRFAGGAE